MENFLYLVAPFGCALMMVVCFGMMAKGMRRPQGDEQDTAEDVAALRAEVARLRAEQREPIDG